MQAGQILGMQITSPPRHWQVSQVEISVTPPGWNNNTILRDLQHNSSDCCVAVYCCEDVQSHRKTY